MSALCFGSRFTKTAWFGVPAEPADWAACASGVVRTFPIVPHGCWGFTELCQTPQGPRCACHQCAQVLQPCCSQWLACCPAQSHMQQTRLLASLPVIGRKLGPGDPLPAATVPCNKSVFASVPHVLLHKSVSTAFHLHGCCILLKRWCASCVGSTDRGRLQFPSLLVSGHHAGHCVLAWCAPACCNIPSLYRRPTHSGQLVTLFTCFHQA